MDPKDRRVYLLAAVALALVPVGLLVGDALYDIVECQELGCIPSGLGSALGAALVVGLAWGFVVKTHREAWAPALTGLLAPAAFLLLEGNLARNLDAVVVWGFMGAAVVASLAMLTLAVRLRFRRPAPVQAL